MQSSGWLAGIAASLFGLIGSACSSSAPPSGELADVDWQRVVSSGPRPQRKAGESSLAYFMREVELSDLRRRERGLKFWEKHPQDPRRYKWLLLTMLMSPHYAKSIDEWAENETRLAPNDAAIDTRAQKRWDERYPALRKAFWTASTVTDPERRLLWFAELRQTVQRMLAAVARGETVDAAPLLDEIVALARAFPEPESELDAPAYGWDVTGPIEYVLENASILGIDANSQAVLLARLEATANPTAYWHARRAQQPVEEAGGRVSEAQPPLSEAAKQWQALPQYPRGQSATDEARVAFRHDQQIMARKYRDIGLRLWDEYPDRTQRLRWLYYTVVSYPPDYLRHFAEGIQHLAAGRLQEIELDEVAQAQWDRRYAAIRSELLSDPELTDAERRQILYGEFFERMRFVEYDWLRTKDDSGVRSLLEDIHELYTEHGEAGLSARFARTVFQRAARYGLDEGELQAFIAPMLDSPAPQLREFAQAKQRLFALRTTEVELQAPTLDGQAFDLRALRGKIVLLDYWSTTCSACIAAMPRIKDVYDRYRHRGFEVISVCLDASRSRRKVERAEKEMGLTWTTLAADGVWPDLKRRYGYESVPQYMLLDRAGRLVAGTSEIDMGRNLEPLLQRLLADEQGGGTEVSR